MQVFKEFKKIKTIGDIIIIKALRKKYFFIF